MKKPVAILLCGLCLSAAQAQDEKSRWVTFKPGQNSQGKLDHQIDRSTIKQEGVYKTFWTRIWIVRDKQPLVFTSNEQLFFWSQKFLVDCGSRRFGRGFVDSNQPKETKARATERTMRWDGLDKFPAVARTVCGHN